MCVCVYALCMRYDSCCVTFFVCYSLTVSIHNLSFDSNGIPAAVVMQVQYNAAIEIYVYHRRKAI